MAVTPSNLNRHSQFFYWQSHR